MARLKYFLQVTLFCSASISLNTSAVETYLFCVDSEDASNWYWAGDGTYRISGSWQVYWYKNNVYKGFRVTLENYSRVMHQCPANWFMQPADDSFSSWSVFIVEVPVNNLLLLAPGHLSETEQGLGFMMPSEHFKPYLTCTKNRRFTSERLRKNCATINLREPGENRIRFGR